MWFGQLFCFSAALCFCKLWGVVAVYVSEDVGWQATNRLREDLTRHCLKLDMGFHHQHKPGEMIERIDGDVANIAIFFSQFVIQIVGNLLLVVGVLVVLLWTDWRISLALLVYTLVALTTILLMRRLAVLREMEAREANSQLFGFLEEYLSGIEDIRASGAVPFVMRKLFMHSNERLQTNYRSGMRNVLMGNIWNIFYTLGHIIALTAGYLLFRNNLITVGSVYLIIHYTDMILNPLDRITQQVQTFQKAAAGMERVFELKRRSSAISSVPATVQHRELSGPLDISFDKITFGYVPDEPVLQDISFELPAGKVLGLLGRTGSGKTTLTRLLFRLYEPQQGTILIGNGDATNTNGQTSKLDSKTLNLDQLRRSIGVVSQDVQLFSGSVRDNITLFDPTVSEQRIQEVIQQLGLGQWYANLEDGLDTQLMSGGSNLSAGEAQLLAFTRLFLQDPGLIILDEASSRLDPMTEQFIEQAVDRLLEHRTGIIVAHRLRTVERADTILILDHGRIREIGARETLVNDPDSHFFTLLQTGMGEALA
ncbi:ABC transporter ATP-binding protein/permease [Chloroflexi bacterium TSY]|nr:ABC transporter ATP-binding protein/permease [Chloroflexi bacterium TSY]